ncbi:peptidylprolyl isomerase [Sphingobium boeckii]|uniref:Parvulin-like PPIase n=1 Tax=Sphingobium boeckii TaxID=1082345 RepID=A0A7W9EDA9_9SPHN|nr:peptidylprolyl isomerase [Sphingobium boeckii]MBB5685083.1 peptidyl-prolyl cis-trans isomerase D [Sphingobium boeckii]
MITFFRRLINSKIGIAICLGFLIIIGIAFAAGDISSSMGSSSGLSSTTVAEVGKKDITNTEIVDRANAILSQQRQQTPGLDMATFLQQGGFEDILERSINSVGMTEFARKAGFGVSKRQIDAEILRIPAFYGPTGQFDRTTFDNFLRANKLSEIQVRDDIGSDLLSRQLMIPATGATRAPAGLSLPYAQLSLEGRSGGVGFIPTAAIPKGAAPNAAELAAFYKGNIGRYTLPERRVIKYALIGPENVAGKTVPSEADIAAYYKENAATYAARETRNLSQVIIQDQNAARTFEAKVKGGASFADAARQAGLSPLVLTGIEKTKLATDSSQAVADAAFATPQGGVAAPQRSGLGWHVVKVDSITTVAGRPLDAVRAEILPTLTQRKGAEALADLTTNIQNEIADGASFDDVVKKYGLKVVTTPAIVASGQNPDDQAFKPDPAFARFIGPMFQAQPGDDAIMETVVPDQMFALSYLESVVAPTPRPLAQIAPQVTLDMETDRAARQGRALADAAIAKIGKGMTLTQALKETGLNLPPVQTVNGKRRDLTRPNEQVPPPLALLFSMAEKKAKRLEAPQKQGWYVVYLDTITPGDVSTEPRAVPAFQAQFSQLYAQEYAAQFYGAAKADMGVVRNAEAIAAVKRQLSGAQ